MPTPALGSLLMIITMVLSATALKAEDIAGSSDHPMLSRFPGAEIVGYDQRYHDRAWIPEGEEQGRWVAGLLSWVVYDAPAGHSTLEIYKNYENALDEGGFVQTFSCKKKDCGRDFIKDLLGATGRMVRNRERWYPGTERHLSAERKNEDDRHTWVNLTVYEHDREGSVRVRLEIIEENMPRDLAELGAESLAGQSLNYDEASLATGPATGSELPAIELEGKIDWSVRKFPESVSAYELFAATRNALRGQAYSIDFQCHQEGCGRNFLDKLIKLNNHHLPKGEKWRRDSAHYLLARKSGAEEIAYTVAAGYMHPNGYAKLRQIDLTTTEMDFNLVSMTGESLADELEASGKVAVYGIYFDTDSAGLKGESDQTLGEILAMLTLHTDIALYVDGHTDDQGEKDYNQGLSQRRAEAVVQWLVGKGIDEQRLQARGFGESRPVSDNTSDAGRAWNRRVELVAR